MINKGSITNRYLIDKYEGTSNFYRIYSDGFVEQGGITSKDTTVNLLKAYKDKNYVILLNGADTGTLYSTYPYGAQSKTNSSFYVKTQTGSNCPVCWYACGYSV